MNIKLCLVQLLWCVIAYVIVDASFAESCHVGTFANTNGTIKCTPCEPGSTAPKGAHDPHECTPCPWGTTSSDDNTRCEPCPPGTYANTALSATCTQRCPGILQYYELDRDNAVRITCLHCATSSRMNTVNVLCGMCVSSMFHSMYVMYTTLNYSSFRVSVLRMCVCVMAVYNIHNDPCQNVPELIPDDMSGMYIMMIILGANYMIRLCLCCYPVRCYHVTEATGEQCVICLEPKTNHEQIVRIGCRCHNSFHKSCIHEWFRRNKTCPVCRTYV